MDVLYFAFSWGSPVGLGLFFFLSCSGTGILFWGLSNFKKGSEKANN
ncbi:MULTISPECIES: hypothetical protein [Shewanella]|nr:MULTISPECIES: hypothetical protein [Shewanella]KPZ70743.1 hypothetical protein AN944_02180 [Shewanella sp. P1-14-1]